MSLESTVLAKLGEAPASGGALIERLDPSPPLVLVYGALHNLACRGKIEVAVRGPGEVVWKTRGEETRPSLRPREPGLPATFSLTDEQIGDLDRVLGQMTAGLGQHYFEELRRATMSRADRQGRFDLDDLGPPDAARKFLGRLAKDRPVKLRLRSPVRWLVRALVLVAIAVLLRLFVVGVYTVPPASISMAPTLIPAAEGGDRLVLANLLPSSPDRGEIWLFAVGAETYVKRVMGLPGEAIEVKQNDLFVGGERLVKERELLDRVAVALPWTETGASAKAFDAHAGFTLPDGSVNAVEGSCRDVIVSGTAHSEQEWGTVTILIKEHGAPPHSLLLGPGGGAAVNGVEVARGADFTLAAGRAVWVTNADRVFRVVLDGAEVARAPVRRSGVRARVEVVVEGARFDGARVYRDVIYTGQTGPVQVAPASYFVLGDHSANSKDSRNSLGLVAREQLIGRALAVVWPLTRARALE
ncbi:MAG: S26 family signal peptidase [Planctomycetota bacterium]|jgi:signal peptidase I